MTALETFLLHRYAIPQESRPMYCGRASARRPCIRTHYPRVSTSPQIANPVAQWWRTLATHLNLLCKLRAREKGPNTINALLYKCRVMGSQFPDDPATLAITPGDRAVWVTALSTLSSTTLEQLGQIMEAAESNAQAATRAVGHASAAAFSAWVAMMAHQSLGTLHRYVKPRDPVTPEFFDEQRPHQATFRDDGRQSSTLGPNLETQYHAAGQLELPAISVSQRHLSPEAERQNQTWV